MFAMLLPGCDITRLFLNSDITLYSNRPYYYYWIWLFVETNFCVGNYAVLYHLTLCNVFMCDAMTSNGCLSWALGDVVWNVNLRGMTSHMAYETLTLNVMWPVGAHSQIKSWWIYVLRPWAYALGNVNGWVTRVLRHYVWRHVWRN